MRIGSKRLFILLTALTMLSFSVESHAGEETTPPQQGESGLSQRHWEIGLFAQGGFPPDYEIDSQGVHYGLDLEIMSIGFEAGKEFRRFDGLKPLRGRGEVLAEVFPFWLARYPSQKVTVRFGPPPVPPISKTGYMQSENYYGASVTPLQLRWNFSQRDSARVVPWAQMGCGVLWTNHKFPDYFTGNTSVINITPQVGAGVNIFNRPQHSIELGVKAIHISNAGLGDHNPGLNQTLQFSLGYAWWK